MNTNIINRKQGEKFKIIRKVGSDKIQYNNIFVTLLKIAFSIATVMFIYEYVKQAIYPEIDVWTSHYMTIIVSTIIATLAGFIHLRRINYMTGQLLKANQILSQSPAVAFVWKKAAGWPVEYVSENIQDVFGYKAEEFLSGQISYSDIVHPEDLKQVADEVVRYSEDKNKKSFVHKPYRIITRHGKVVWIDDRTSVQRNALGQITHYQGIVLDITDRKRIEEDLRASEEKYRKLINTSPDAIAQVDENGRFLTVNPAMAERFGLTKDELEGRTYYDVMPKDLADNRIEKGREAIEKAKGICFEDKRAGLYLQNYYVPFSISCKNRYFQIISRDITVQKEMENKLKHMSLFDSLTGLYSRNFFEEEMKRLEDGRYCPIGIIVCDIDGLKLINDTFGHNKGDELLKAASNIIRNSFRTSDILARIGGDEFAVLMPCCSQEVIKKCCDRIRKRVENYNQRGPKFVLSISIGYSVRYNPPVDMKELFKKADDAMYKQKIQQSYSSRSKTVQALIKTMEARDYYTEGHAGRLRSYALRLGRALGLSEERLNDLQLLGRFHDLGKVGIPDKILFKPGVLSGEEFQEMKRHSEIGHRIALSISDLLPIADLILKHHEWWNGQGYPLGLKGKDIPLECRILAIVDAYDAMTSERPYKIDMSHQEAVEELRRGSGTQFDPNLVEEFIGILEKDKHESKRLSFVKN